jgi:hypothetical protein
MAILKIRDENDNIIEIPALKGDKGDAYILTDTDKQDIASIVAETELNSVDAVLDEILASQASYLGGGSV